MKHSDEHFTISEVERLCQLYLECELSLQEELELEYVLSHDGWHSPLIDETRQLMVVSRPVKFAAPRRRVTRWWLLCTAASVAIVLGTIGIVWQNVKPAGDDCIVYVSGERVGGEAAHEIAEADVARMQQFLQAVSGQKAAERAKVEQFMNHIHSSK